MLRGALYFFASDGVNGRALWRSDGTESGTVVVRVLPQLWRDARIQLHALDGRLHFNAFQEATGWEPWVSDGTAGGTRLLRDLAPGPASSNPRQYTLAGRGVYSEAETGATVLGAPLHAVWRTDGTAAGTDLVAGGFRHAELGAAGQTLYFGTSDDTLVGTLWKVQDGAAKASKVRDFPDPAPFRSLNYPRQLTALNGLVTFTVFDDEVGFELWRSDGTAGGTRLVKDILPGAPSSSPWHLRAVNGVLYFQAASATAGPFNNPSDQSPWRSDGTAEGTVKLRDVRSGAGGSDPDQFTPYKDRVVFVALSPDTGREVWDTDGTEAGTRLLKDVNTDTLAGVYRGPVVSGGRFFFTGNTADAGTELYVTDGTAAGTLLLKDIVPGPGGSDPSDLTDVDGILYFLAIGSRGHVGRDLWKSDGTAEGTVLVKADAVVQEGGWSEPTLVAAGGALFFSGADAAHGMELWKSDGTEAGTAIVKDVRPGPASAGAALVAALGDSVLFWANDDVHGA